MKTVQRSSGRSSVAAAAYRAGARLTDDRTGLAHDYTEKKGVDHTQLVGWSGSRQDLWDAAESAERRKDATTAREYEIALPAELNHDQKIELTRDYAGWLHERHGVAVDVAIHGMESNNPHAHLMTTTRETLGNDLGPKVAREWSDTKRKKVGLEGRAADLKEAREMWEQRANLALEKAGHAPTLDHRSLGGQGLERAPTVHLGPSASEMERKGTRTERGDINRSAHQTNQQHTLAKAGHGFARAELDRQRERAAQLKAERDRREEAERKAAAEVAERMEAMRREEQRQITAIDMEIKAAREQQESLIVGSFEPSEALRELRRTTFSERVEFARKQLKRDDWEAELNTHRNSRRPLIFGRKAWDDKELKLKKRLNNLDKQAENLEKDETRGNVRWAKEERAYDERLKLSDQAKQNLQVLARIEERRLAEPELNKKPLGEMVKVVRFEIRQEAREKALEEVRQLTKVRRIEEAKKQRTEIERKRAQEVAQKLEQQRKAPARPRDRDNGMSM